MHSVATPSALPWAAGRAILPAWIRVVAAVALAKAVIGWGGIPGALETAPAWRVAMFAAHVGVFGAAGVTLHLLGRRDARAVSLGLFFLVLSGAWADRLLEAVADSPGTLGAAALLLRHLQVIAFAPFFFWLFILDFPRRRGFHRHSRLVTAAVAASLGVAAFLLVANLLLVAPIDPWLTEQARAFDRGRLGTLFWPLVFAVGTPAIPYAGWQARSAAPDERRRVHLLLLGLLGGVAPEMVITSIASAWPGFAEFVRSPEGRRFVGAIVYPPMLAIPFLTGYAVVVHRALDVRFLVRRVVQYALARYTLVLATTLPFLAAFCWPRWREREGWRCAFALWRWPPWTGASSGSSTTRARC